MTETGVAYQYSLFGGEVVADDVVERVKAVLLEYPEARCDYDYLWLLYLQVYHELPAFVRAQVMQCVLAGAPSYRTVANRAQELMRADASLQPAAEVMEHRQRQRRQGRVR